MARFPEEMWQFRTAPDRWTIHEIVIHIADSEANSYIRCRGCLAEPGCTGMGYDEDRWARALGYHDQSTEEALELFKWLRRHSVRLIKDLPVTAWSLTVDHTESGVLTLADWLDTYARHSPEHVEQMQASYEAWVRQRASSQRAYQATLCERPRIEFARGWSRERSRLSTRAARLSPADLRGKCLILQI